MLLNVYFTPFKYRKRANKSTLLQEHYDKFTNFEFRYKVLNAVLTLRGTRVAHGTDTKMAGGGAMNRATRATEWSVEGNSANSDSGWRCVSAIPRTGPGPYATRGNKRRELKNEIK